MSHFTINIQCAGAAFEDGRDAEISRILRRLAERIDDGRLGPGRSTGLIPLHDINGNQVGAAHLKQD